MSSPDQLIVSPVGEIPVLASTAQYLVQRVQRRRQTLHRDSLADRIRTGPPQLTLRGRCLTSRAYTQSKTSPTELRPST